MNEHTRRIDTFSLAFFHLLVRRSNRLQVRTTQSAPCRAGERERGGEGGGGGGGRVSLFGNVYRFFPFYAIYENSTLISPELRSNKI